MTWFKVDDKFWSHPKSIHVSSTALGIWCRAGAYCADHLTDGVIEERLLHTVCPEPRAVVVRAAAELVAAELWEVIPGGWRYHDWSDHQPSRKDVEADRAAGRERQRKSRERRRAESQQPPPVTPLSRVTNA